MSLAHWFFLDSNCTDITDIYCFSQSSSHKSENSYFAIITEGLPQTTASTRSDIGAKLLVDASQTALSALQKKELDFTPHFFSLLKEDWKTKVLLHAIQNPLVVDTNPLSIEELTKNSTLSEEVLKHYDASIGIIYLSANQLVFLQSGDTQLALLNKRNNCEIKKSDQQSLSATLNSATHSTSPSYQLIDIEKYQLEMMALLPHKYTAPKTGARLKSNILKIYRSLGNGNLQIEGDAHVQLTILKKEHHQNKTIKPVSPKKTPPPVVAKKDLPKKRVTAYALSVFLLLSGGVASYFLWQVQANESTSLPSPDDSFVATQVALNDIPELSPPEKTAVDIANEQAETKKQADELKDEQKRVARRKAEEVATKKAQIEKEKAALQKQKEAQAEAAAEALKVKEIEIEKARKEKELQERLEQETKEKIQQLEQEKKLKLQQEEKEKRYLNSIEKDFDVIYLHDKRVAAQLQSEEQNRRKAEARVLAEKQAEAKRAEALVKQRRREFEKNKQAKAAAIKSTKPKSREELQLQNQAHIKQKEMEKKRVVAEELKKQQASKVKAKEAREKDIQKTITHQLVNYSKTFHRHVVQLKQKNQAIELLERRKTSSDDPNIIRNQKMLQSKKIDIEQRIDRLSVLYVEKLKRLCTNKTIYPVVKPAKLTKVERIALSVISQKLRNCSQPQTLSSQNISSTLINRYLK